MMRRTICSVAVFLFVLMFVVPASAEVPTLSLSHRAGRPGLRVTASGGGLAATETVVVSFDASQVATSTADASGTFRAGFTVPAAAGPGIHQVMVGGEASGLSATSTFEVRVFWPQFRFNDRRTGYNPYENVLDLSNVAGLQPKWSADGITAPEFSSPAVWKGAVYAGARYGRVLALEASSGQVRWSRNTERWTGGGTSAYVTSSPTVEGGIVYIGLTQRLIALKASTGRLLWSFVMDASTEFGPTVADGIVYVAGNHLYALDARTGSALWEADGSWWGSSPAVSEGIVYVGGWDAVFAYDAVSGVALWSFPTGYQVSTPAVAGRVVYAEAQDGTVYALEAGSGALIWSRKLVTSINVNSYASPAVARGSVYVADGDGGLSALKVATGQVRWSVSNGSSVEGSPSIANGVLYIDCPYGPPYGSTDGFCARNASTGELLWYFTPPWDTARSSPAVVDGAVYVAASGAVYAFSL
jgi:outer membrane protein assembly factor BamB